MDINGTRIHYRMEGPADAPVVVLSHSLGADLSMWDHQVPALMDAGFRILRYDHRGHGRSEIPMGPYTLEQITGDAMGLVDRLELETFHFCGLSMGGMVGQALGAACGKRIRSLVLCSTAAHMPPPEVWNERIDTVRSKGLEAVVDATIDRWFTPQGQQRMTDTVMQVRRMILQTPVEGFCACAAAIRDMDLRETITAMYTPTRIIAGEDDPGTTVDAARFIHRHIRESDLVVIAEASHYVHIEQTGEFNRSLTEFLTAHR